MLVDRLKIVVGLRGSMGNSTEWQIEVRVIHRETNALLVIDIVSSRAIVSDRFQVGKIADFIKQSIAHDAT